LERARVDPPDLEPLDLGALDFEPLALAALDFEPLALAAVDLDPLDLAAVDRDPLALAALDFELLALAALDLEPLDRAPLDAALEPFELAFEPLALDLELVREAGLLLLAIAISPRRGHPSTRWGTHLYTH
jgi:hypothetical protein